MFVIFHSADKFCAHIILKRTFVGLQNFTTENRKFCVQVLLIAKFFTQEAQLLQRNSTSAAHVYLGWLTDHAMHRTLQNRRCTTGLVYSGIDNII